MPSAVASSSSVALPTSWVMAVSCSAVADAICSRTGVASLARIFTRRMASSRRFALDGQRVGVDWRDQLAVVGELALDEPGGEPGRCRPRTSRHARRGAASPRRRRRAAAAARSARDPGTSTFWSAPSTLHAGQVADRQPVRVGGHQPQPVVLGGQQHPGEDRAGLVGARGANHLAQRIAERRSVERDGTRRRRGQPRVVVERQRADAELRATAADADVVARRPSPRPCRRRQRADDVGWQTGGQHHATVVLATDGQLELDREIEVGAGDRQLVAGELEAQPRQHRAACRCARWPPGRRWPAPRRAVSRSQRNFTGLPFSPRGGCCTPQGRMNR